MDNKPTDERKVRVQSVINLDSADNRTAAVRRMRGFELASMTNPIIQLQFEPADKKDPAAKPLRISRVHVFRSLAGGTPGQEISLAAKDSQTKTYRFACPDLVGGAAKAAYLVVTDDKGNRSAPIPVTP